jgi:putative ABC transport system permease protein
VSSVYRLGLARLRRSPTHTATQIIVLAGAVALLGAMILFIGNSMGAMTASTTRSVPLDLQGPVGSYGQASELARMIAAQPNISHAAPAATAPFSGMDHQGPAGITSSGAGAILAVPPSYSRETNTFRFLRGSLLPGEVVLDQQLAATLQATVGDKVSLRIGGKSPARQFTVGGVALVTAPDVLFQPLNPQLGPAPAQPPSNVVIVPLETFAHGLARELPALSSTAVGSSSAVPGAQSAIQWQVHVQIHTHALTGSPSHALAQAGQIRNSLQRTFTGRIQFVDNLSESLETAAGDALYAETLFVMLAVPGALLALGLAYLAALGTVDRDRRELALLRARGASGRDLLALTVVESGLLGLLAGPLGAGFAFAAVALLIKGSTGLTLIRCVTVLLTCTALAIAGAIAARVPSAALVRSATVAEGRLSARRERRALWRRLYLDVCCLAISGGIYWLTASTGFSAVVNPDSNPTLSLAVYMFFAPALLWIGATLLLVRMRGSIFELIGRRLRGAGRPRGRSGFLLASLSRRGPAINRGLILVGLLLAFGVSLGIFTATYDRQVAVDAELTLGADVTATAPPGAVIRNHLAPKIAAVPGVSASSTLEHAYAYVGPDLQDTFGVDAATIAKATTLRSSYFIGAGAQTMMQRLRSTPDGILVSKETITDYSLKIGDLLRLRVLDHSSGKFATVPFHVVGAVQEFPSAPRDSFMVTNLAYLERADHAGGPNVVFAKATEDPRAVAARVRAATQADGTIVKDIRGQSVQTSSSITTVDLTGISRLEETFTILLAAAAMWLFVSLIVRERRHEFATMAAVGASLRDIGVFVRSEALAVLGGAMLLAAVLGWLLAEMLVAMLQHVFDPPPESLSVPWGFLAFLLLGAILGAILAAAFAARDLRRLPLGAVLREH